MVPTSGFEEFYEMGHTFTDAQIKWLQDTLEAPPEMFSPNSTQSTADQGGVGQSATGLADGDDLPFRAEGPLVQVPVRTDGAPHPVLEINAGAKDTDLGLPPDPVTGDLVDSSLIDLTRTDIVPRPGVGALNANEPIPQDMQGRFGTVLSNNPHGYSPDPANVADALRPGGRMIVQGRYPANKDFKTLMDDVAPLDETPRPPPGMSVIPEMLDGEGKGIPYRPGGLPDPSGRLDAEGLDPSPAGMDADPADILGSGFNKTSGEPTFKGPNARLILEKNQNSTAANGASAGTDDGSPVIDGSETTAPGAPPGPQANAGPLTEAQPETPPSAGPETPPVGAGDTTTPVTEPVTTTPPGGAVAGADSATSADAGAISGAEGGIASAGVVGGLIAGGLTILGDAKNVLSGTMSVADAAKDAGAKTLETGVLTTAGVAAAKQVASTVGEAGGVVGGIVGAGLAAVDDYSKVKDGTMTGGEATADVGIKGGIGVAAGALGAMAASAAAGSELGAALGTVVPGAGNVIGFVAGAAVGAAVGLVGNALAQTETGQEIEAAAGHAIDEGIGAVKDAGHAIANFFGGGDSGSDQPTPSPPASTPDGVTSPT
jgi:hypothetical protein